MKSVANYVSGNDFKDFLNSVVSVAVNEVKIY